MRLYGVVCGHVVENGKLVEQTPMKSTVFNYAIICRFCFLFSGLPTQVRKYSCCFKHRLISAPLLNFSDCDELESY